MCKQAASQEGSKHGRSGAHLGAVVADVLVEQAQGVLLLLGRRVKQVVRLERRAADGALRPVVHRPASQPRSGGLGSRGAKPNSAADGALRPVVHSLAYQDPNQGGIASGLLLQDHSPNMSLTTRKMPLMQSCYLCPSCMCWYAGPNPTFLHGGFCQVEHSTRSQQKHTVLAQVARRLRCAQAMPSMPVKLWWHNHFEHG